MIKETLEHIGNGYLLAKTEDLSANPMAEYIKVAGKQFKQFVPKNLLKNFTVKGSAGIQNTWADVPWIAFMDTNITKSTQDGYYITYLFSVDMKTVTLSLGQGITNVVNALGQKDASKEFRNRANFIISRIKEGQKHFSTDIPDLKSNLSNSHRPRNYEQTSSYSVTYDLSDLPKEEKLKFDLVKLIELYCLLTLRGGLDQDLAPDNYSPPNFGKLSLTEKRKYKYHRRLEGRNSSNSRMVKRQKGYICEICNFDFEEFYGDIGKQFIEAHHKIPFSTLPEDEVVEFDINDFSVLCSNCHRMVHKRKEPYAIDEMINLIEIAKRSSQARTD